MVCHQLDPQCGFNERWGFTHIAVCFTRQGGNFLWTTITCSLQKFKPMPTRDIFFPTGKKRDGGKYCFLVKSGWQLQKYVLKYCAFVRITTSDWERSAIEVRKHYILPLVEEYLQKFMPFPRAWCLRQMGPAHVLLLTWMKKCSPTNMRVRGNASLI